MNKKCPKSEILKWAYVVLVQQLQLKVGLRKKKRKKEKDKHMVMKTSFSVVSFIVSHVIIIAAVLFF